MSFLDFITHDISRKQWFKLLAILSYWVGFFVLVIATSQPYIVIIIRGGGQNIRIPIHLFWDMSGYNLVSFNNLSPFAPRYFLIIILSLLSALRSESFDISSKLLSLVTLIFISEFLIYTFNYPPGENRAETSTAFPIVVGGSIMILMGLLFSYYYSYLNWKDDPLGINNLDNLYPQSE